MPTARSTAISTQRRTLCGMRAESGPQAGRLLFDAPTIAALLLFFMYALQCMSTVGVLRRETGSWKWPAIAFGYMFVVAWVMALGISLAGFAGGLTMSAIKRDRGVKDYGSLIEGHGGILDRIDSICFASPLFFHVVRYFYSLV